MWMLLLAFPWTCCWFENYLCHTQKKGPHIKLERNDKANGSLRFIRKLTAQFIECKNFALAIHHVINVIPSSCFLLSECDTLLICWWNIILCVELKATLCCLWCWNLSHPIWLTALSSVISHLSLLSHPLSLTQSHHDHCQKGLQLPLWIGLQWS